ncbi:forkhead box D1, partial [Chelydra serpentina]
HPSPPARQPPPGAAGPGLPPAGAPAAPPASLLPAAELARTFSYPPQASSLHAAKSSSSALARSPFSIESIIGGAGSSCASQSAVIPVLARSLVSSSSVSSAAAALGALHQGTALSNVENFTARISNC